MRGWRIYILIISVLLLAGCKNDDYVYPPAITEILSAQTDESGTIRYLLPDKGEALFAENGSRYSGLVPDSVYRMIGVYQTVDSDNGVVAHIYSIQQVISYEPVSMPWSEVKTDSVTVQSIWRSRDYINLILQVKSHIGVHVFRFAENGYILTPTGSKTLALSLYHDKGDDLEAYTQRAYMSVPLSKYAGQLKEGDIVSFTINAYKKGLVTYQFPY